MLETEFRQNSLILHRNQPGRILQIGKKIEIELANRTRVSVRPKDIYLLHPGPIETLRLAEPSGDIATAWELLAGETTTLAELATLAYNEYTPHTAWAAWQAVMEGVYFHGTPEQIISHTAVDVAQIHAERAAKQAAEEAWQACLLRIRNGRYEPSDTRYLQEVLALAYNYHNNSTKQPSSKLLRALGHSETPEQAHALLLKIGYWDEMVNPYPHRFGLPTHAPTFEIGTLPDEARRDLTHLPAFAIDDEGNQDPDDAISLENGRLWVHVADAAALIPSGSAADEEACNRGANIYLPEGVIPMLPPHVTEQLGLGLHPISPALSFGIDFEANGAVADVEVVPSWVKVTRLTYAQVEQQLNEPFFRTLSGLARRYEERRRRNGAVFIEMPEVKIQVSDGQVHIRPLPPLHSRALVREAMLMAGEAVAKYAVKHSIPLPFTIQDPPDTDEREPTRPSQMLALRKKLQRSQQVLTPGLHAGLGLSLYAQTTSPLRRYLDLVVHQQLRAHLYNQPFLSQAALIDKVGRADAAISNVRQTERLSNTHWKLVYLLQNPGWLGEGIILEQRGNRSTVLLSDIELETELYVKGSSSLDGTVWALSTGVDLPRLEASFRA